MADAREDGEMRVTQELLTLGKSDPKVALTTLKTDSKGLSYSEANARLTQYGPNEIAREKPPVWWRQLIGAFLNPFIIILLVLCGTSYVTDVMLAAPSDRTYVKIIILGIMIFLSAMVRFWQEFRSQKAAQELQKMVQNKVRVLRTGGVHLGKAEEKGSSEEGEEIPVSELVPGDMVLLSAGDMIPADLRLISSLDLFVSQSALTGESMPVEKFAVPIKGEEEAEFERDQKETNPLEINTLCFMGSSVISGSGVGVVVVTGDDTAFGSTARVVTGERPMTNFDKGVASVSWALIYTIVVMVVLVFLINGYTKGSWYEAFLFAIAVAVGLLPEMLPLIVTANLSKGVIAMSKQKVIVKKLNAVQNFGAMDVLCTDKTGTITENKIILIKHLDPDGKDSEAVYRLAYLNSYFQTGLKNLLDHAVLERKEIDHISLNEAEYKKIDEVPFDFMRRRMSVVLEGAQGEHILICKGAVEEVLSCCVASEHGNDVRPLSDMVGTNVRRLTEGLNKDGLRVVAVAYKKVSKGKHIYSAEDEKDLVLAGYIGFLDPPKASATEAIAFLEHHGVDVKIITGDNEIVTERVCREVHLKEAKTLLGSDITKMTDDELANQAEGTTIFAKVDPTQKARIILALKAKGHVVGYMGDGINDAAAMRTADVSVSVDTAVDIAKESADIILLEQDLHVLGKGIVEGRTVFGNIMKYIKMTTSSNFGNMFSVLIASAWLPFLPMLPLQILVQNMLYDFSQLAIPWDRMDSEFLRIPRKWETRNIVTFMLCVGPLSSIFDILTFLGLWFVFAANTVGMQSLFQSGWFIEGLVSQTIIVHLIRTRKIPFIQSTAALPLLISTLCIIGAAIVIPFTALGTRIGLSALPALYFVMLTMIVVGYMTLVQLVKGVYIGRFKSWL